MLSAAISIYLVGVNAANDPPAYAYRGLAKQAWVALGLHHFSHPCMFVVKEGDSTVLHDLPTNLCYRMSQPKRMRGVWIDEFEGSKFVSGARDASQARPTLDDIWLDVETNRIPTLFSFDRDESLRAYRIDFIGRQTLTPGPHGHLGGARHEVIVDRLTSAQEIDATPYARNANLKHELRSVQTN